MWSRYKDPDYKENYCHGCGNERNTTYANAVRLAVLSKLRLYPFTYGNPVCIKRLNRARGIFTMSSSGCVVEKVAQICFRIEPTLQQRSVLLFYTTRWRGSPVLVFGPRWAINVTRLNKANRTGVVRAIARSFPWRWVSKPRWARWLLSKVVSTAQRCIKKAQDLPGERHRWVDRNAWGAKVGWGSRRRSHRIGTGGRPV